MKETICMVAGLVGGFIATLLGGWNSALSTLVIITCRLPAVRGDVTK